jgi:hypothetical protein
MLPTLGLVLMAFLSARTMQDTSCKPETVLDVAHGRDYTMTICGVGVISLRGVEAPLRSPDVLMPLRIGPRTSEPNPESFVGPNSAELVGGHNIGPEAIKYLSKFVGRRVTLVNDGYRMGDGGGRRYAYVFLPDKTLVNAEMIRLGLGYADRQGTHPRRDEFIAIEAGARRAKLGVWSEKVP